jgi:hypothetical protein
VEVRLTAGETIDLLEQHHRPQVENPPRRTRQMSGFAVDEHRMICRW